MSENNKRILSVVVPVYNASKTVENIFTSLPISQVFNDIEFILIDDGSKDNSWEVLNSLQEKYGKDFLKIYKKENGNWGSVHNFAKKIPLSGKYVKTLDSDDYLDSYALIKFIKFLKELPEDIDIIFSNVNFVNNENKIIAQKFYDKLFTKKIFKVEEIKLTKLSVLTVHAFTSKREIYQSIPDLPTKMSYMDSLFIFYLINASNNYCTFFRFSPLYQYQCGNEDQTISINNLSKHSDWVKCMLETQAKSFVDLEMDKKNSFAKNKVLGQMIQLGYYHFSYATANKFELSNSKRASILYNELLRIKEILGENNFKKYYLDSTIRLLLIMRCKLFPHFTNIAAILLNNGYLKATKKNGERKNASWYLKKDR